MSAPSQPLPPGDPKARIAELEQHLAERTDQLKALGKEFESFTYTVSHDLRAPMRAIDGFARMLVEDYGDKLPDDAKEFLRHMTEGATRMNLLLDGLLAVSRLGRHPLEREPFPMADLVRDVAKNLNGDDGDRAIEFKVGAMPGVSGDVALLKQLWSHLLSNARKFTRGRNPAVIEAGCREDNGETIFFLKDNGIGLDMRHADKLFGIFQRLHRPDEFEGVGVGLALVKGIVQRHGGRVWIEGEPGKGATVSFTLGQPPMLNREG